MKNHIDLRKLPAFGLETNIVEIDEDENFPHIVLIPTEKFQFSRRIGNSMFVSPGALCKDESGTYADIIFYQDSDLDV